MSIRTRDRVRVLIAVGRGLRIGSVRLTTAARARFQIPDAKTATGIRGVVMSPDPADAFVTHLDRHAPRGAADRTRRLCRAERFGAVASVVSASQGSSARRALASETREQQGLPPLPRTAPHTLRRTYISIALSANKFDGKWVMGQVGHADSKMTMDVYPGASALRPFAGFRRAASCSSRSRKCVGPGTGTNRRSHRHRRLVATGGATVRSIQRPLLRLQHRGAGSRGHLSTASSRSASSRQGCAPGAPTGSRSGRPSGCRPS